MKSEEKKKEQKTDFKKKNLKNYASNLKRKNSKPFDMGPKDKNPDLSQYLSQNYEAVLKKAKNLEKKRKELEMSLYKKLHQTKQMNKSPSKATLLSNRFSNHSTQRDLSKPILNTQSFSGLNKRDYQLEVKNKEQKRSRNENESNTIRNYIKNATTKKMGNKKMNKFTPNAYRDYSNSLDIQDSEYKRTVRKNLSTTMDA